MKIKITGVQPQSYSLDNGFSFTGEKVHAIDLDTKSDGQIGNQVMTFRLDSDSPLTSVPLIVGEDYTVYFTPKGKVDFLAPYQA